MNIFNLANHKVPYTQLASQLKYYSASSFEGPHLHACVVGVYAGVMHLKFDVYIGYDCALQSTIVSLP